MDEWFCEIAGRETGPLSSHQLKTMAVQGQIVPTDRVRRGPAGQWVAASHVRGLFAPKQEPPPQPSPAVPSPAEPPPAEPPSFFASADSPAPSFADAPAPQIAWSSEPPISSPAFQPPPPPLPPEPQFVDAAEDESVPMDIFAEPIGHAVSAHAQNLARMAHARRKRQQQMLMAGALVFMIFGLVVAGIFIATANVKDLVDVKEGGGLSGLSKKLERQKPTDNGSAKPEIQKNPENSNPAKPDEPKADDDPAAAAALRMVVGDVPVRIVSLVRDADAATAADGPRLLITVEVKNPSTKEKLEFAGWNPETGQSKVTLTDDQGKTYPAKPIDASAVLGKSAPFSIEPSQTACDVLAFELPGANVQSLQLELPGAAFGKDATASFKVPAKLIVAKSVVANAAPSLPSSTGSVTKKSATKAKKHTRARPGTPEGDFGLDDYEPPAH